MMVTHADGAAHIFVLVDALGWELLQGRPFLDDILKERHRVRTILGYSSGAIPTLLTGKHPDEHGHWNLFYRSPDTSPFRWTRPLRLLPQRLREWRGTRRVVRGISQRLSGYSGYFAIYNVPLDRIHHYDLCERGDIYAPNGLAPTRSLFDELRDAGVPYECYNYHRHSDAEILALVPERLRVSDTRTFFLYLCELDAHLHHHVSNQASVTAKLAWYEERVRGVYQAALARWGAARLYIFSDHGMTRIVETRDMMPAVRRLGLSIPDDYLPAYDSTMARFWIFSDRAEARLRDFLDTLPYGRLVDDAERRRLRIAFDDRRYGDLIFVLNPGVLLSPSDMGRVPFDGMHGFHPDEDPDAAAVLLASEPLPRPVTHTTEVLPVLLRDVGVRAGGAGPAS
jgi:hypothetical protein